MVMLGGDVGRIVVTSALPLSLLLPLTSKWGTVVYSSEVTTSPELSAEEVVFGFPGKGGSVV